MSNNSTISVREMANKLGICMPTAYALTEQPGFPVIRIGRRKLIPVDGFERWLKNAEGRNLPRG